MITFGFTDVLQCKCDSCDFRWRCIGNIPNLNCPGCLAVNWNGPRRGRRQSMNSEYSAAQLKAVTLKVTGMTYSEIGERLGVSHQRIQQLCQPAFPIREFVADRASHKCQMCAKHADYGHIHHIFNKGCAVAMFNHPLNLAYLCRKCHAVHHIVPIMQSMAVASAYRRGKKDGKK